jgi:hypothetical protein
MNVVQLPVRWAIKKCRYDAVMRRERAQGGRDNGRGKKGRDEAMENGR